MVQNPRPPPHVLGRVVSLPSPRTGARHGGGHGGRREVRAGGRAAAARGRARGRGRAFAGASAVATAAAAVAVERREPACPPSAGTPRQRRRHFRSLGRPREGADAHPRRGGRGRGLGRVLAHGGRGRKGRGRRGGGSARRRDPSPGKGQGRRALSAVLVRAGLRGRVPREGSRKGGLLRLLLG